jgi:subtilisin family serine protease
VHNKLSPLDLVKLTPLMARTRGDPGVRVALIDGPVLLQHPELSNGNIRIIGRTGASNCLRTDSIACAHGTFVAAILSARRGSDAPAICPDCTLLVRPILPETLSGDSFLPSATPDQLAEAIIDAVDAGARVLNMSLSLPGRSGKTGDTLADAFDYALKRGRILVVSAGNEGAVAGSSLTRYSGTIPVAACDLSGVPTAESNLGIIIAKRGLRAPGRNVVSLGTNGRSKSYDGTSVATPFVTGTIALLWSEFPTASADQIRSALISPPKHRRNTIVPPLLDAWAAFQGLSTALYKG